MNTFLSVEGPGLSRRRRVALFGVIALSAGLAVGVAHGAAAQVAIKQVAEGFTSPVALAPFPDGSGRLAVVDQVGAISVLDREGKRLERPLIDLRGKLTKLNSGFDERGVLGIAFHPKFQENNRVFIHYSAPLRDGAPEGFDHTIHLSEFKVDGNTIDPGSERVLLQIDEPYFNHNGGTLAFGPDGYLYIACGDGGNANDVGKRSDLGNGQDLTVLLGKILRIDVDKGDPYAIPQDNPFANGGGRPEIYAYGLRNPWKISFDRGGNHELIAADVGQNRFEEINIIVRGGNYGWNIREGFECFDPKNPNNPPADCPKVGANGEPLIDPVLAYKSFRAFPRDPEARGTSVTGGYVYRGKALPSLAGKYVFADWAMNWVGADGVVYVASRPAAGSGGWSMEPLPFAEHPDGKVGGYIVGFGEDADGELYVMTTRNNTLSGTTGKVWKIVPAGN